jgi:hypothetical protein
MARFSLLLVLALTLASCSNKVLVKKDSCKEVFGGALLECEKVEK